MSVKPFQPPRRRAALETAVRRVAAWYTPLALAAAVAVAVVPPLAYHAPWPHALMRGVTLAVLASPFALLASAGAAFQQALVNALRHGVVVHGGAVLESAAGVSTVALDEACARSPDAHMTVDRLRTAGIRHVAMLSTHDLEAALAIGQRLEADEVQAELAPADQPEAMRTLRASHGPVMAVGDPIDDLPAFMDADVSVALGPSARVADASLGVADLALVPYLPRLGQAALAVTAQNIALAVVVKAIALALFVAGWLPLWLAVVAEVGAWGLVIANARRLAGMAPER